MNFSKFFLITFLLCALISVSSLFAIGDDEDRTEQHFIRATKKAAKHIDFLASELDKNAPEDAKKGGTSTSKRALLALASLLREKHVCAAVCIAPSRNELLITFNESGDGAPAFINALSSLLSSDRLTSQCCRHDFSRDLDAGPILEYSSRNKYGKRTKKTEKEMRGWLRKLIELRDHKDHDGEKCPSSLIYDCLVNKKINFITQQAEPQEVLPLVSSKTHYHAEMQLLDFLYEAGLLDEKVFIAISKKCCLKCAAAMEAANKTLNADCFQAKESHFSLYPIRWQLPNFLLKSEEALKTFIGDSAYSFYDASPLFQEKFIEFLQTFEKNPRETKPKENKNHSVSKSATSSGSGKPSLRPSGHKKKRAVSRYKRR